MLDYISLGILVFVGITIFYGIIVIHDHPYEIAKLAPRYVLSTIMVRTTCSPTTSISPITSETLGFLHIFMMARFLHIHNPGVNL